MSTTNYVCYRLPEQKEYVRLEQHEGEPLALKSVKDLKDHHGFVFAPFQPTDKTPVWLLQADKVEKKVIREVCQRWSEVPDSPLTNRKLEEYSKLERLNYHLRFSLCKKYFLLGKVSKVVIARHVTEFSHTGQDPEALCLRACQLYPHQLIALVCLKQAGTWLMATPEVLLEGDGQNYHTMALAGTQKMPDNYQPGKEMKWSEKTRKEQRLVAS